MTLSLTATEIRLPASALVNRSASPYVLRLMDELSVSDIRQAIALTRSVIVTTPSMLLLAWRLELAPPGGSPWPTAICPPNHGLMLPLQVCLSLLAWPHRRA